MAVEVQCVAVIAACLGSVTCIRCSRATLECGGLICTIIVAGKMVPSECVFKNVRGTAKDQCPRYVAASLRAVHSAGVSTRAREGGQSATPSPSAPRGRLFPGGKVGVLGGPPAVEGHPRRPYPLFIIVTRNDKRSGGGLPRSRLVSPPDTDSQQRAVSAERGSGRGDGGLAVASEPQRSEMCTDSTNLRANGMLANVPT